MMQRFIKLNAKTNNPIYINTALIVSLEERGDGWTRVRAMGGEHTACTVKETPSEIMDLIHKADYHKLVNYNNYSGEVPWDTQTI